MTYPAKSSDPLLSFEALEGGYADTRVLRGMSGQVAAGACLAVLGRNGVGKTTLARLLMGYLTPFAGTVRYQGQDLSALPPYRRNQLGISYAPQELVVFDNLSVADNLVLHRPSRDLQPYESYFQRFPRLRERLRQQAGTLSGGEKKILSFCRVLAEERALALLDEPTEGVQKENIDHMAALVLEHKRRGKAFLVIEQNIAFLEAIADDFLVLDHGEVVAAGSAVAFDRRRLAEYLTV